MSAFGLGPGTPAPSSTVTVDDLTGTSLSYLARDVDWRADDSTPSTDDDHVPTIVEMAPHGRFACMGFQLVGGGSGYSWVLTASHEASGWSSGRRVFKVVATTSGSDEYFIRVPDDVP